MLDQFGRKINYLRISLTDRCNLRCRYCMPQNFTQVSHTQILRYEEVLRVCAAAVALGITRFKITGGEPLVRRDCVDFMMQLKNMRGAQQVALTTNGTLLEKFAPQLMSAQLDGVNISLDTLNAEKYHALTGGNVHAVLRGIEILQNVMKTYITKNMRNASENNLALTDEISAYEKNLPQYFVKLNCVALESTSAEEIVALVRYAEKICAPLRFIELMPLACNNALAGRSGAELREILARNGFFLQREFTLQNDVKSYGNGPAIYYRAANLKIPIGFIEPVYNKFCASCNRVRLTSTGILKTCLYGENNLDMKALLRGGATDAEIKEALRAAIFAKPAAHNLEEKCGAFAMNTIGG